MFTRDLQHFKHHRVQRTSSAYSLAPASKCGSTRIDTPPLISAQLPTPTQKMFVSSLVQILLVFSVSDQTTENRGYM